MILLAALILGLLAGLGLARLQRRPYSAPEFKSVWLAAAAFAPQLVVAYGPGAHELVPPQMAAAALPVSLAVFLLFVWINRRLPGMPLVLAGLVLNLVVIASNGGWMPISPETASQLPGGSPPEFAITGIRVSDKDILLRPEETRLEFLADRYLMPDTFGYRAAFSLGDMFVAAGVFWLLARPPVITVSDRSRDAYD